MALNDAGMGVCHGIDGIGMDGVCHIIGVVFALVVGWLLASCSAGVGPFVGWPVHCPVHWCASVRGSLLSTSCWCGSWYVRWLAVCCSAH